MRYYVAAFILKFFSLNQFTRYAYRLMGNVKNAHTGSKEPIREKYFFRTKKFLDILHRNNLVRDGIDVVEIGTGWVHWEALMLRNECSCSVLLYDVWDNRSFGRFKRYAGQIADLRVRQRLGLEDDGAAALMASVALAPSLEAAYKHLGFRYLTDPTGLLQGVPDNAFDLLISSDVGEHLLENDAPKIIERTFTVLRPGGFAYHQIVLADHLKIYAKKVHPKQYLNYPKRYYKKYLRSKVQYINMIQIPEWRELFQSVGFSIIECDIVTKADLSYLQVHQDWADVPMEELQCTVVQFLLKKPE